MPALAQSRRLSASPEAGVSDHDESSQFSVPLPPSSPLTDGDTNADGDAKPVLAETENEEAKRSGKDTGCGEQPDSNAGVVSTDGLAQNAAALRAIIQALGDFYHGRYPAHCEQCRLTVQPFEFLRLEPLLSAGQSHENDSLLVGLILDIGLRSDFVGWAKTTKWEYDPQRTLLIIHMNTVLHQLVLRHLEDIVTSRLKTALGVSGHGGSIIPTNDLKSWFISPDEPTSGPEPEPGSTPGPKRVLPQRACRAGEKTGSPDLSKASSPEDDPMPMVKKYCPDLGFWYKALGEKKDYYPGCVFEVGFSHPLEEWKANRMLSQDLFI